MGILIAALFMNWTYGSLGDGDVEKKARELGMIYPGEAKVLMDDTEEVEK